MRLTSRNSGWLGPGLNNLKKLLTNEGFIVFSYFFCVFILLQLHLITCSLDYHTVVSAQTSHQELFRNYQRLFHYFHNFEWLFSQTWWCLQNLWLFQNPSCLLCLHCAGTGEWVKCQSWWLGGHWLCLGLCLSAPVLPGQYGGARQS